MTREPSFNAPTSEHTLKQMQDTIAHVLYTVAANGIGANTDRAAESLTIAIDMHTRQLIKETKHD